MKNFLKRSKHAYALFNNYRKQGISIKRSLLLIIFKVTNLFWKKYNVYEEVVTSEMIVEDSENNYIVYDFVTSVRAEGKDDVKTKNKKIDSSEGKKIFIWVIPHCINIWGGGHYTLFRFINFFAKNHNIKNIIYLYDYNEEFKSLSELQAELNEAFSTDHFFLTSKFEQLPSCIAAIATTWQSAYFTKEISAEKKFYFMQDYESLFYVGGTLSLQANYTYGFGFHGITGGNWLKNTFESYGYKAQAYIFSADRDIFYPSDSKNLVRDQVKKIFFYGRPSTERRAYELGITALEMIASNFPNIEIVIAGLSGIRVPKFKCTLLGNLSLKETGDLYRTCDIGIALSATNMSYLPVELMASGCPVVSNDGPQVEWYCKDQYNSFLTAPIPSAIFQAVQQLVNSKPLRKKLALNGLKTTSKTTWDEEIEKIYQYINSKITHENRSTNSH